MFVYVCFRRCVWFFCVWGCCPYTHGYVFIYWKAIVYLPGATLLKKIKCSSPKNHQLSITIHPGGRIISWTFLHQCCNNDWFDLVQVLSSNSHFYEFMNIAVLPDHKILLWSPWPQGQSSLFFHGGTWILVFVGNGDAPFGAEHSTDISLYLLSCEFLHWQPSAEQRQSYDKVW